MADELADQDGSMHGLTPPFFFIAKILKVEENRPLKMKQMPPKKNPK